MTLYEAYKEEFSKIGCMEIANHEALLNGVFKTTYANGVQVITNYNMYPVTCEEGDLNALGYLILQ